MHLSDALLSTPVALTGGAVAATLLAVSGVQMKKMDNPSIVPMMGVLGAFVFAAQMINFAIPGTGSSGHIIGGVMLAAFLGPWAAFVTIAAVLIIQCLIFADGGLLALGCNLINMGATTTLLAYPLVFKPILGNSNKIWRITLASIIACTVGLELGACFVSAEVAFSDISALSGDDFLKIMTLIHLPIGIVEGVATAAVLCFVSNKRPELIHGIYEHSNKKKMKNVFIGFAVATLIISLGLVWFASENPDGLEWSVERLTGQTEIEPEETTSFTLGASKLVHSTSVMPDYDNPLSGIIGAVIVLLIIWSVSALLVKRPKHNGSGNQCQK